MYEIPASRWPRHICRDRSDAVTAQQAMVSSLFVINVPHGEAKTTHEPKLDLEHQMEADQSRSRDAAVLRVARPYVEAYPRLM